VSVAGSCRSDLEEAADGNLERQSNALNIVEGDITRTPFHVGNESPVQASLKSERFLRPTAGRA